MVVWTSPATEHRHSSCSLSSGLERKTEELKWENSWVKIGNSISKGKTGGKRRKKSVMQRQSHTTSQKQSNSQPVLQQQLSSRPTSHPTSPQFLLLSMTLYSISPLASLGQLFWLCSIRSSCVPAYLLGSGIKRKPCSWAVLTQSQPKHWGVIDTILGTNPKHSTT